MIFKFALDLYFTMLNPFVNFERNWYILSKVNDGTQKCCATDVAKDHEDGDTILTKTLYVTICILMDFLILYDFLVTVKAASHECIIRTNLP